MLGTGHARHLSKGGEVLGKVTREGLTCYTNTAPKMINQVRRLTNLGKSGRVLYRYPQLGLCLGFQ